MSPGVASLSDLVRSSLRLRPDRIPIGEVRGAEALDLLKAWGTGHPGGVGTIHAGSALGALRRMEQLIQEAVVTVLDELNRQAFGYRWSSRAIMLDKTDATKLLTKIRRQWFAKRKSVAAILKEVMTNEASVLLDTDASNKAADADLALQELGADEAGIAYVTATITVWDRDPAVAAEKLRLVEKIVQSRDFTCTVEGVNALEAWFGSLPGHVYANVRQPPVSTLNLAHLIPLSAVWAGAERDEHFGEVPLLYGKTEGSTPFRLTLHVGDVGHMLVVGPTGAGKSVLLALMALQFRRYAGSQIFAFDYGGSIRAAAMAMGGDWQDLGGALHEAGSAGSVALQPLARIDEAAERAWAAEWLAALLAGEGVAVDPAAKEHLWSALTSLATAPVAERTLTGLAVLLQSRSRSRAPSAFMRLLRLTSSRPEASFRPR